MLGEEIDVDRAIELYGEMLPMDDHVAATVANRVISRHENPGRGGGRFKEVFRDRER
jgi:hypothetical protein